MHFLTAKVMKLMNTAKADGPKSKIMKKKLILFITTIFNFVYCSQQNISKLFITVNKILQNCLL